MKYDTYEEWVVACNSRGYNITDDGTGKMIAHVNGDECGWFDPNYGGSGFGELY